MKYIVFSILSIALLTNCSVNRELTSHRSLANLIGSEIPHEATLMEESEIPPIISKDFLNYSKYSLDFNGITFVLAADQNETVRYLATSNPEFKTPQGVNLDSLLVDTILLAAGPMVLDGDSTYLLLKSGWWAVYSVKTLEEKREYTTFEWFFLK